MAAIIKKNYLDNQMNLLRIDVYAGNIPSVELDYAACMPRRKITGATKYRIQRHAGRGPDASHAYLQFQHGRAIDTRAVLSELQRLEVPGYFYEPALAYIRREAVAGNVPVLE